MSTTKGLNLDDNLERAARAAANALKDKQWRHASVSLIIHAALIRFLRQTRSSCPHVAAFDAETGDRYERINAVSLMDTVPPEAMQ